MYLLLIMVTVSSLPDHVLVPKLKPFFADALYIEQKMTVVVITVLLFCHNKIHCINCLKQVF